MMRRLLLIAMLGIIVFSGCVHLAARDNVDKTNLVAKGMVAKDIIEKGDTVTLYYVGTYEDGTIFDQTSPGNPATFQVGVGNLIPGFDNGLLGLKRGESKHIAIPAADAYGEVNPLAIVTVPDQKLLDANIALVIGHKVTSSNGTGVIVAVDQNTHTVKIDFNHPLAGKNLIFDVNIVQIKG